MHLKVVLVAEDTTQERPSIKTEYLDGSVPKPVPVKVISSPPVTEPKRGEMEVSTPVRVFE